jgi:hypothetical protein
MLCGKGRVQTQDLGYQAERHDQCATRPVNSALLYLTGSGRGGVAASRLRFARSCCIVEPGSGVEAGSYTRDQPALAGCFENSRTAAMFIGPKSLQKG